MLGVVLATLGFWADMLFDNHHVVPGASAAVKTNVEI
jgi:hypothetical protein